MEHNFTHFDHKGNAVIVDVSQKEITHRQATASGKITMNQKTFLAITQGTAKKGDVLGVARIAGIMGVKKTHELIPMCHPLFIEKVTIDFALEQETNTITVACTVKTQGKTGVEMEALCGVNVALMTIYDMCKALDRSMRLFDIVLLEKQGGKSGHYQREQG